MNDIADRIRAVMGESSVRGFALALGKSPSTVQEYLKGRVPPADFIARICERFGVSERWMLTGRGRREGGIGEENSLYTRALDLELLTETIELLEQGLAERATSLPPTKKARLIATAYDLAVSQGGRLDQARVQRLIELTL